MNKDCIFLIQKIKYEGAAVHETVVREPNLHVGGQKNFTYFHVHIRYYGSMANTTTEFNELKLRLWITNCRFKFEPPPSIQS